MPSGFNSQACSDDYTAATTIEKVWSSKGGWLSVSGQPVFVRMQWSDEGQGLAEWTTEEQELGAGAFAFLPPGCTGVQFRNAVAGQVATVTAWLARSHEPALSISTLGSITVSGLSNATTRTVVTGSGNYATPANARAILVECVGGGGGGGGANTGAGTSAAGGSGGGGAYAAKLITNPAASYAVVVGAAGNGGAAGANPGTIGGDTTFGGALVVAKGGQPGVAGPAITVGHVAGALGGLASASTGDVTADGGAGQPSIVITASVAYVGGGGSGGGPYGGGPTLAPASDLRAPGNVGTQYGGGGTGGLTQGGGAAQAGGAGHAGVVVVTEFY